MSSEGVWADPDKIEAVKNSTSLLMKADCSHFMVSLLFISAFSKMAAPLFALAHRCSILQYNEQYQDSFISTEDVGSSPLFMFPKSFVLEAKASTQSLRATLSQQLDNKLVAQLPM